MSITDSSISDPSDSIETHTIDDTEHSVSSSSELSKERGAGVAEAALRDGEKDYDHNLLLVTEVFLVTSVGKRKKACLFTCREYYSSNSG